MLKIKKNKLINQYAVNLELPFRKGKRPLFIK